MVVNYFSALKAADEVVAEVEKNDGKALAIKGDVANGEDAQALIKAAVDTFGKIDILVNNAGITRDTLIMKMTEEDWEAMRVPKTK